jgi:hypothetical protein
VSSTATEPASASDRDAVPRGSKATPNHDSEGRALEATVPAKGDRVATAEAIQAVRVGTGPVRDPAGAAGASAAADAIFIPARHRVTETRSSDVYELLCVPASPWPVEAMWLISQGS